MFVIRVGNLYYLDASYCWTPNINQAKKWTDRSIPENILTYWNKVHYERADDRSCLCGQTVFNRGEIITCEENA